MAVLPGPNLPAGGATGYNSIGNAALSATDFLQFDFVSGILGTAHPDFSGGAMYFGLAQVSNIGPEFNFTNAIIGVQYDNLRFDIQKVPEPGTSWMLLLLLPALAYARRPVRRST